MITKLIWLNMVSLVGQSLCNLLFSEQYYMNHSSDLQLHLQTKLGYCPPLQTNNVASVGATTHKYSSVENIVGKVSSCCGDDQGGFRTQGTKVTQGPLVNFFF